jgi:hypothetical protein
MVHLTRQADDVLMAMVVKSAAAPPPAIRPGGGPRESAPLRDERLDLGIDTHLSDALNAYGALRAEFDAQPAPTGCSALHDTYREFLEQTTAEMQREGTDFYARVEAVRSHDTVALARLTAQQRARQARPNPIQPFAAAVDRVAAREHERLNVSTD